MGDRNRSRRHSHYRRLLARTPAISGRQRTTRISARRWRRLLAGGGTDHRRRRVCHDHGRHERRLHGDGRADDGRLRSPAQLHRLVPSDNRLPSAEVLVVSIPNWYGLWQGLSATRRGERLVDVRPLPGPVRAGASSSDRTAVSQRIHRPEPSGASVCAEFAACTYDGGAVYNLPLGSTDLTFDYFHLSPTGQAKVAAAAWRRARTRGRLLSPASPRPPERRRSRSRGASPAASHAPRSSRRWVASRQQPRTVGLPLRRLGRVGGATLTDRTGPELRLRRVDVRRRRRRRRSVSAQATPAAGSTPPPTNSALPTISGTPGSGRR